MTINRSPITSHVLDISVGKPAAQLKMTLEIQSGADWNELAKGVTDKDGRVENLLPPTHKLVVGHYRLNFFTEEYFEGKKTDGFYPSASVTFKITKPQEHYHIPLLLSPFGYSTYRGT